MTSTSISYLDFVSSYFNVKKEKIIQELQEKRQDLDFLRKSIGPLTRSLSSLIEVKNGGDHDCAVKILTVSKKLVEKEERTFTIYTLLVADQYSICKFVIFDTDILNRSILKENTEVRLHEVYYEKKEAFDDVIKLKRGGNVFPVPFSVPGMHQIRRPATLTIDELGEYVSDPKNVSYIQELGIVHTKGILYKETSKVNYLLLGNQFKLSIRIKDELEEFIDDHCLDRLVTITNVRIRYGRGSLELSQTEFSKILISNYTKNTVSLSELIRYEYPAQKMSLREMLDTGMVALPSGAITHTEDRQTEEGINYLIVYLYDSTALVRLYLFEESVIEVFRRIQIHKRFRILSGIYKKTMREDPKYANALPIANLRIKDDMVDITE